MWQHVLTELQKHIVLWRERAFAKDELDWDQWAKHAYTNFQDLIAFIQASPSSTSPLTDTELAVAASLLILAPGDQVLPPESLGKHLVDSIETKIPNPGLQHCLETVIAWGCGWDREVKSGGDPWERRWLPAIFMLRNMTEASVHLTVEMVKRRVDLCDPLGPDEIRLYADLIAIELMQNRCGCGSHERGCKEKSKHLCCRRKHRLSSWQPTYSNRASKKPQPRSLRSHVAEAVRGNAGDTLLVGAFAYSTLFPRLRDDARLRIGNAEFKVCHACGEMYEGTICPNADCRTTVDIQKTRHVARKNWLLVPYDPSDGCGSYVLLRRWRCATCGNLFSYDLDQCPLSHAASSPPRRSRRFSLIWVYRPRAARFHRPAADEAPDFPSEPDEESWV